MTLDARLLPLEPIAAKQGPLIGGRGSGQSRRHAALHGLISASPQPARLAQSAEDLPVNRRWRR